LCNCIFVIHSICNLIFLIVSHFWCCCLFCFVGTQGFQDQYAGGGGMPYGGGQTPYDDASNGSNYGPARGARSNGRFNPMGGGRGGRGGGMMGMQNQGMMGMPAAPYMDPYGK
jgi:hypothetical protein